MRSLVYILASRYKGTLYVGMTRDLSRRVEQHRGGYVSGFTNDYKIHQLVYFEGYGTVLEARTRERVLKRWRREWKFKLIESINPEWRDLTPELIIFEALRHPGPRSASHHYASLVLRCAPDT